MHHKFWGQYSPKSIAKAAASKDLRSDRTFVAYLNAAICLACQPRPGFVSDLDFHQAIPLTFLLFAYNADQTAVIGKQFYVERILKQQITTLDRTKS